MFSLILLSNINKCSVIYNHIIHQSRIKKCYIMIKVQLGKFKETPIFHFFNQDVDRTLLKISTNCLQFLDLSTEVILNNFFLSLIYLSTNFHNLIPAIHLY